MKQLLVVSSCTTRGDSGGLTTGLINHLNRVNNNQFEISIFDIGFFNYKRSINAYKIKDYYIFPTHRIDSFIRKIPIIRGRYAEFKIARAFDKLLGEKHFDLIIVYEIPIFADRLVKISHKHGAKIIFYPWGSDILRRSPKGKQRLQNAFDNVDYVTGNIGSNCAISASEDYGVPEYKLKLKKKMFLKGIKTIDDLKGKYTKREMLDIIGIPFSDYVIVCGYNGNIAHRHKLIIESFFENYSVLPSNYVLVFPITYGCQESYYLELKEMCSNYQLNAVFLRDYLTDNQIALLHLAADLYIDIQPTDCGNAFMIESLYADNQIITGRWLGYKQFEQFGIPYHLLDNPEGLSLMLNKYFTGKEKATIIPESLKCIYRYPTEPIIDDVWSPILSEL